MLQLHTVADMQVIEIEGQNLLLIANDGADGSKLAVLPDGQLQLFDPNDKEVSNLKIHINEYIESIRDGLISNKLDYDEVTGLTEIQN